jgi:hypothetical protein
MEAPRKLALVKGWPKRRRLLVLEAPLHGSLRLRLLAKLSRNIPEKPAEPGLQFLRPFGAPHSRGLNSSPRSGGRTLTIGFGDRRGWKRRWANTFETKRSLQATRSLMRAGSDRVVHRALEAGACD